MHLQTALGSREGTSLEYMQYHNGKVNYLFQYITDSVLKHKAQWIRRLLWKREALGSIHHRVTLTRKANNQCRSATHLNIMSCLGCTEEGKVMCGK